MIAAIEAALQHDVAGDPITGIRWTRRTTEKIATELATLDIQVCPRTVARILKDLDYRLRVNHKRVSAGSAQTATSSFSTSPSSTPNSPNAACLSSASIPKSAN